MNTSQSKTQILTLEDVKKARESIKGVIRATEVEKSFSLSKILNAEVILKAENQQFTGSFKLRGAYNKIFHLTNEEKKRLIPGVKIIISQRFVFCLIFV